MQVQSFPPILGAAPEILILGSMPGIASIRADQYYAHPRNAFWPIMGSIFGFDPNLAYADRVRRLMRERVAVWDVLQTCYREGSLDAAIDADSIVPNDLLDLVQRSPGLRLIAFNGAKAESIFNRHVRPQLEAAGLTERLLLHRLPSTSPAHAAMSLDEKCRRWAEVLTRPHRKPSRA